MAEFNTLKFLLSLRRIDVAVARKLPPPLYLVVKMESVIVKKVVKTKEHTVEKERTTSATTKPKKCVNICCSRQLKKKKSITYGVTHY